MSKGVHKHCSVLNYIRHADEEMYELIQDLCIGRMFVPKRGSPGLTFLRPDKSLLKEIQSMASGDNPEEAVEAIQALVLLDNISSIKEFDDKRSDIPTYLRQKLPVMSADGKKVTLKNGAEIHPDKDFEARGDRANINVFLLSKALVPTKTEDSDFSNAKVKRSKKEGGADLGSGRASLFEAVLNSTDAGREPAMEMLVELHKFLKDKSELQALVASQCSYDALASLAIVLQPYKAGDKYLDDATVSGFITRLHGQGDYKNQSSVFGLTENVASAYDSIMSSCACDGKNITAQLEVLSSQVGKLNIVKKIESFLMNDTVTKALPPQRRNLSKKERFAEAELRVLSAIAFDNEPDRDSLLALYKKCALDEPYMCADQDQVKNSNIGFYFSTVYLIARSDALAYLPGVAGGGVGLDKIFDESRLVCINDYMKGLRADARNASNTLVNGHRETMKALLNL